MRLLAAGLLLCCLGALWLFVRNDVADYAAFKQLRDSADRQKRFRLWVLKSLALFSGATIVCLLLLGRIGNLTHLPGEFNVLSKAFQSTFATQRLLGAGFFAGLVGTVIVMILLRARASRRRGARSAPAALGDIAPLMPRNGMETCHAALLALNAGFSEELFFRLLLPLLLTLVMGNAAIAFGLAAIIFGLVHLYQGWLGVLATTILGLVLTGLYLGAANLWLPVTAHVTLDLLNLVVRPTIARLSARTGAALGPGG